MLVDSNNQILCRQISYLHMLGHAYNNLTITRGTRTPLQTRFKRSACRWVIQESYRFFFFKLIGFFLTCRYHCRILRFLRAIFNLTSLAVNSDEDDDKDYEAEGVSRYYGNLIFLKGGRMVCCK